MAIAVFKASDRRPKARFPPRNKLRRRACRIFTSPHHKSALTTWRCWRGGTPLSFGSGAEAYHGGTVSINP
jgi:hypothetical protein